jgi:hypothetical protein
MYKTVRTIHLFMGWKPGHQEWIDGLEVQQMKSLRPLVESLRRDHLHNEVMRKQSGDIHTCTKY